MIFVDFCWNFPLFWLFANRIRFMKRIQKRADQNEMDPDPDPQNCLKQS